MSELLGNEGNHITKDVSNSYNELKEFGGKKYTGMRVGGNHKWYYDRGEWDEKKLAPDKWEFTYAVTKRRAWYAPEGSGVPVGTEYHWYILADQNVRKLDANNYTTTMTGFKYKLAHKRAQQGKWNITDSVQRKRLIQILQEVILQLKRETIECDSDEEV
jgi:hypothetical protein